MNAVRLSGSLIVPTLLIGVLCGCTGSRDAGAREGSERAPAEQARVSRDEDRRAASSVAAAAIPKRLVVLVAMPEDRDGNGFADQIPVILYLFGNDELPMLAGGTLRATLRTADGVVVRQWAIPSNALQQGARRFPAGPAYQLGLQLEPGQDRMPRTPADLFVQFEPEAAPGQAVSGVASLHLGGGPSL